MGSIVRTKEGTWRAHVRRKGKSVSRTFKLKSLANEWVVENERLIDTGGSPFRDSKNKLKNVSDLIDLHISDLLEVGKPIRRSKRAVLEALKMELGHVRLKNLDRATLIKHGRKRAKQGAGPVS